MLLNDIHLNKNIKGLKVIKKILFALFIVGLAIFLTWDNEEKHAQKERNVQLIEENIQPYLSD